MADTKITDLAELTGASSATGDVFPVVDVSDTTMAASGTTKKMTRAELAIAMTAELAATPGAGSFTTLVASGATTFALSAKSTSTTGGVGYATGAGGAVTQTTSRTTGVTLDRVCGAITLFSVAGSATFASFTVTNSAVAATDTVVASQKSGTDLCHVLVTNVAAGSFKLSVATTGGTTVEAPVINFAVIKAVAA